MSDIMNITAVPYGNAEIDYDTETVTCQHGEEECSVNAYEQCGMYLYPDQAIWMPYYVCLETKGSGEGGGGALMIESVPECASAAGMDPDAVEACHADDALVWQLQQEAAEITDAADHSYTPWVVVDGDLMNYDFMFKHMICEAYTGTLPPACGLSVSKKQKKKEPCMKE